MPDTFADLTPRTSAWGHALIETFPIQLPDGRTWTGTLFSTPTRRNGRRVQVRDADGAGLFDTGDCIDLGNARNALEMWLAGQVDRTTEVAAPRSGVVRVKREPVAV